MGVSQARPCVSNVENPERDTGQPFPRSGALAGNLDKPLARLTAELAGGQAEAYWYVTTSVKVLDGRFRQFGSGPNWQAGVLTMCTCKHHMRTFKPPEAWPGTWIVGFTSKASGEQALLYLARVQAAFGSHAEIWRALDKPARQAKASRAAGNIYGDLYELRGAGGTGDPYDPRNYHPPCEGHVHLRSGAKGGERDYWHKDVGLHRGKPPALLLCDPRQTYIWTRPTIGISDVLGQGQRKGTIESFLSRLRGL